MGGKEEHIGIVLVHGIGEQRRFEHLDGELRPLIEALLRRVEPDKADASADAMPHKVTVEIVEATASAVHADHDTWSTESGAPVRIIVNDGGVKKHIHIHEVWWADVNEPYSLRKQIKFWGWGLSVWLVPAKLDFDLPDVEKIMDLPKFPPQASESEYSLRFRLFCVCNVFAMAGFSLGAIVFFLKRLLGFQAPPIVKILVNYIGAVKLYSQQRRSDGGFLDAYSEPPRVSIRRRMIRTLADVALAKDYCRWYVFAHSLGSVVAFNGLQENAHALPNYLSQKQYEKLKAGIDGIPLAGDARPDDKIRDTRQMLPGRPLWLKDQEVVYRDRLLEKFRGVLTYGSPLDKFAAIWPARVPINKEDDGLAGHAEWINVYDPTDPVTASLDAFGAEPEAGPPAPRLAPTNLAYAAHPVLLLSHLRYFDGKTGESDRLADCLMRWVLGGGKFQPGAFTAKSPWLEQQPKRQRRRTILALASWVIVYLALTCLGALSLPLWESLFVEGGGAVMEKISQVWGDFFEPRATMQFPWLSDAVHKIANAIATLVAPLKPVWNGIVAIALLLLSGLGAIVDCFVAVFGRQGLLTQAARCLGVPALVDVMIKLSLGVMIFVALAGAFGWLLVFDRKAIAPARKDVLSPAAWKKVLGER